jgi:hypothetical protein
MLSALLAAAVPREQVEQQMAVQFGMTAYAVNKLTQEVLKSWGDDEAEQKPHYKRAAIKRIIGHIAAARAAKQYSAVSSLERLLAQIQGTMEPIEIHVNLDATVRESVLHVVAEMTPERLRAMAEAAMRMRVHSRIELPAPAATDDEVLDVAAE